LLPSSCCVAGNPEHAKGIVGSHCLLIKNMKRKRKWIVEYWCDKNKMNILKKVFYCKEPIEDKNCTGCKFKDSSKNYKEIMPNTLKIADYSL